VPAAGTTIRLRKESFGPIEYDIKALPAKAPGLKMDLVSTPCPDPVTQGALRTMFGVCSHW